MKTILKYFSLVLIIACAKENAEQIAPVSAQPESVQAVKSPWTFSEPLVNPGGYETVFFFFGDSNAAGTAHRDSVSLMDSVNVARFQIWRNSGTYGQTWQPMQLGFNTDAIDSPTRVRFGLEAAFLLSHLGATGLCSARVIKAGVGGHHISRVGTVGDQSIHPDYRPISPNPPTAIAPSGVLDTLNAWERWGCIQTNKALQNLRQQGIEPVVYLVFVDGYNDGVLNQGAAFEGDLPTAIAGFERDLDIDSFAGVILPELSHRSIFPNLPTATIIAEIQRVQWEYALSMPDQVKIFSTCDAEMLDNAHWNTAGTMMVGRDAHQKFEEF